ncbi:MAG: FG-GAP-like repeat-containing protein [Acidobacteriota bacterium]
MKLQRNPGLMIAIIAALLCQPFFSDDQDVPAKPAIELDRLSDEVSLHAAGRGNPSISLSDGRELMTSYIGQDRLVEAIENNEARGLSLASADFDEDGVADLICGYGFAQEGVITLHRGNVDSIYPNSPEATHRKAEGALTDAPFLAPARVFALAEPADFIGAGDFDADGHWDVVAASRGGDKLLLLTGDGKGGLSESRQVELPDRVTAMVVGEINRRDGLDDVVVGVYCADGPKALVFEGPEGALRAKPEIFDMPDEVTSLALGQLDESYEMDLAIAAGHNLVIAHGRDRKLSGQAEVKSARIDTRSFSFAIRSIATGDFTDDHRSDIALLSDDGAVRMLSRINVSGKKHRTEDWRSETLVSARSATGLVRTRVSSAAVDTLIATDSTNSLCILTCDKSSESAVISSLDLESEPMAVLEMRLNKDALSDLVILRRTRSAPTVMMSQPQAIITVNNPGDSNSRDDALTLREAMLVSNGTLAKSSLTLAEQAQVNGTPATPGLDEIRFNIGSGTQTITPTSFLPSITDAVVIDGTTQPGFAGHPVIELNGTVVTSRVAGLFITAGNTVVRGLVINRFANPSRIPFGNFFMHQIFLGGGGGNIIEGNFIGLDITGTQRVLGDSGISICSSNNLIGGTVESARNVISMVGYPVFDIPTGIGVEIALESATGNQVKGNYLGTNANGTAATGLPTDVETIGVRVTISASNTVIGGTEPHSGNIIGGNTGNGVAIDDDFFSPFGASATLVQGNLIGVSPINNSDIGNGRRGIQVTNSPATTIGGTSPGAANVISNNDEDGILLFREMGTIIEGNYIGTDSTGTLNLGNGVNGVSIENQSVANTVRRNVIAFNQRNGISITDQLFTQNLSVRNVLLSNSIFSNSLLGIDLGPEGVTPNDDKDPDTGANALQNYPVLLSATLSGTTTIFLVGTLNSTPNTRFSLEFFFGSDCQEAGHQLTGAMPVSLGIREVTTDGNGNAVFTVSFEHPAGFNGGWINSTATDPIGNTSEFSGCIEVPNRSVLAITIVTRRGKKLIVEGRNFDSGAKILINGQEQRTRFNSSTKLTGRKAGRKVNRGDKIRVRNSDGTLSNEITISSP